MQVHRVAYDTVGGGKGGVDIAVGHLVGVCRVPFYRVVELCRSLGRGLVDGHHRGERLVLHGDQLGRVLGLRAAGGDHDRDGLALVAHAIGRQRRIYRCHQTRKRDREVELLNIVGDVGAGEHGRHARRAPGGRRIDQPDPGMGLRAPQEGDMQQPAGIDVVDVSAAACEHAVVLLARGARANESCSRVAQRGAHTTAPASVAAAASTASTIGS